MYFFDHQGAWNVRATQRLAALAAARDIIAFSDLVRLECRVKSIMNGDSRKLAVYDGLFARADLKYVAITPAVFDRATLIRARNGFKLGDSLHLAAALESGCNRFLTNDVRLNKFTDIFVEVLA